MSDQTHEQSRPTLGTREYDAVNEEHCADPQPGDYWHEMFCPYLVVLLRIGKNVIVCQTRKDFPDGGWTWDMDKPEIITLERLREIVTYGRLPTRFVADVAPGSHKRFSDYFASMLKAPEDNTAAAASEAGTL